MDPTITVGIIGAVGAVLAASIPYYFTKKNEIALTMQKTKLERYDELLQTFVKWIQTKKSSIEKRQKLPSAEQIEQETQEEKEAQIDFIMAYQRASSFASANVLKTIEKFLDIWTKPPPHKDKLEEHNTELRDKINDIFRAIRADIQTTDKEQSYEFKSIIYPKEIAEGKLEGIRGPSTTNALD